MTHREITHFAFSAKQYADENRDAGENIEECEDKDNRAQEKKTTLDIKRFLFGDATSESSGAVHTDEVQPDESVPRNMRDSLDEILPPSFIRESSCVSLSMSSAIIPPLSPRTDEVPPELAQSLVGKFCSLNAGQAFGVSMGSQDMQEKELERGFQAFSRVSTHTVSNGIVNENSEPAVSNSFHNNASDNKETSLQPQRVNQQRKKHLTELYYRGVMRRKKLVEKLEAIREAQAREHEHYTFQPIITKRGRSVRRFSSRSEYYKYNAHLRQRLLLEAWRSETTEQCRPVPVISKGSEIIVRRVRGGSAPVVPASERLYLDSARRRCKIEEEEVRQKIPVVVRTLRDIKAHVDDLYLHEEKRKLALQKLREEAEKNMFQASLHVSTKNVVKRLTQERSKTRFNNLEKEEDIRFKPKLSSATDALTLRARRRRLEKWYRFWCQHQNSKESPQCAIFERIQAALQAETFSDGLSLDIFCNTLEKFEEIHGTQLWRSILPPSEPHVNEELTFVPKVNPYKKKMSSSSIHQRLFQVAKTKQITSKKKEQMQREAEFLTEEKRKKKLQVWSARNSKITEMTRSVGVEVSLIPSLCSELAQNSDFSCGVGSSSLSQLSSSSGHRETTLATGPLPEKRSFLNLLNAADALYDLIDEPNEIDVHYSSPLPSNAKSLYNEVNLKEDSFTSAVEVVIEVETDSALLPVLPRKQEKPRRLTDVRVSTDILLECALSRRTWSADVSTRRREECEHRRRLQEVGKALYQRT